MHVLLFPILLSSLFVLHSTSSPLIEPQSNDLVQLHSTELDSGHTVTHFGVSENGIARRSAGKDPHPYGPKNCVTPSVPDCNHFTNAATADACDQLSIWLGGCSSVRDDCGGTGMNASTKAIDQTNRNICHGGCCIYWTKNVPGLKYQDLRDKVDNLRNACYFGGYVSGKSTYLLRNTCLSICVNNGGTGCKDTSQQVDA